MFTHMNYIYEVYKERSFSNAAKNLYISQSSLSLTIKRAEEKIGKPIFDRSTYPIQLTEFGQLYISAVEEIRGISNNLTDYIYDVNQLRKGHLSVGAGNFFSTYFVAPVISEFKEKYPNISVNILESRTLDLEPQLANGNIDILVTNGQLDASVYHKYHLFHEQMLLVISRKYLPEIIYPESVVPFEELLQSVEAESDRPGVSLQAFSSIPFIGMRQGNDSRIRTDQMMRDAGFSPAWVVELDQSSTAFRLACDGMGACIVGDPVIRKLGSHSDIVLYKINHPQAHREVAAYTRNTGYVTRTVTKFIEILQQKNLR